MGPLLARLRAAQKAARRQGTGHVPRGEVKQYLGGDVLKVVDEGVPVAFGLLREYRSLVRAIVRAFVTFDAGVSLHVLEMDL